MKLNRIERWVVNNPLRAMEQRIQMGWLKSLASIPAGSRILEVGCGRGAGAHLITKEFQPARLHAMDLDPRMVRKAKRYLSANLHAEKTLLYVGDAVHLPCGNGAFDAVFGFGVLHHVPDWRAALAEISRVLRVGGVYFIEEIYPPVYQNFITSRLLLHPREDRFHSHDLHAALAKMGLRWLRFMEHRWLGILGACTKSAA
jgi:ubiquinone/menaquinone biosynthesis C-methylase UbiE